MRCVILFSSLLTAISVLSGCGPDPTTGPGETDAHSTSGIEFIDATQKSGIDFTHIPNRTEDKLMPEIIGSGLAIVDVNRDGAPDVVIVNSGILTGDERPEHARTRLYINDGKGNFTDKTQEWGLPSRGYGMGVAVGDFDNDGYPDLFLTHFDGKDVLLRNTGSGFDDVTERSGIASDGKWSTSAGFFDLDNDGHLDLYVVKYVLFDPKGTERAYRNRVPIYPTPVLFSAVPDRLFRNNSKGTFTDISERVGLDKAPRKGLALAIADLDLNGHQDIYVANDTESNQLWKNENGSLRETAQLSGAAFSELGAEEGSMGADVSDIEISGLPDIAVTNFQTEATSIYKQKDGMLFAEVSDIVGVGRLSRERRSWGIDFFDINNNGLEDLLFVNGHIEDNIHLNSDTVAFAQQNSLFLNLGDGNFRDISSTSGTALRDLQVSRGLVTADLTGNGALDFIVTNNGGTAQVGFNTSSDLGNFVILWLEGTRANRSAIGARAVAKIGDRTIQRQVMGAQSYLSVSDLRLHFGLDKAEKIDELIIHWPGSKPQVMKDLMHGAFYYIREGNDPIPFIPGEKRIEP
jgi:enediyne biosynthesis protein E4